MKPNKITCRHIWKVFGPTPERIIEQITPDMSRGDILARTGHVVAVRDVTFDVGAGEIFVVMGLSGSGKSTLIRCLTRLIEPTRGQITINGTEVTTMNDTALRELRRHTMSMVFQRFGLFPHRRVVENVAFGLEVRGMEQKEREKAALEVLHMVGLKGWEYHYPHELSGGMQQRVGLARALAVNPEVLLCDEPFSALDPLIRREMQDELLNLQKSLNKTIVFITHDFLEALKIGERIAIMKDGVIVQIGTPEEIVAHPADAYVREFTKDVPRVKVLTARTIMKKEGMGEVADTAVHPDDTLEKLIPYTAESDNTCFAVIDDSGKVLGYVNRVTIMLALTEEGALL
ncbi:MAG: glycine betaine/L-proline ABC transporter ATP-binding protein [Ardenticatenaceae bacterium]|nr:glycine betaine/L-proline ABC transporter ATP-binding protein [Ardenticatenaceae bacterium]